MQKSVISDIAFPFWSALGVFLENKEVLFKYNFGISLFPGFVCYSNSMYVVACHFMF